jgi:iron complex transport system ATP-binding protein
MTALLEARAVSVGGRLRPTDLTLAEGSLTALIGPNGSGKTSLLRALAAIAGDGGSVHIDGALLGTALPARRARLLAFVPASRDLAWPISARDVIALGQLVPEHGRIDGLIATFELDALADRPVTSLSTGERTRVLIARALAAEPRVLLLDEPFANLDPYWVLRLMELLRECTAQGCAALVAVHDIARASDFDRVLLMDDGCLRGDGSPSRILASAAFGDAFRIEAGGTGWRIRPLAGPRSPP